MRGIVFTAGGWTYFTNAYLNCRLLREKGCKLPIEWFYMGEEMLPEMIEAIQKIPDVRLIDLGGYGNKNKENGGWQSKIRAIMESSFDEVLYLDADSFPQKDPTYLFDHPFYKETGCVLFPDIWHWQPDKLEYLNKRFGIELAGTRQVEGGQMMFNKLKCMEGLKKVEELHELPDIYKVVYGDKDTFLIGMLMAKCDFRIIPHQTGVMYGGLIQHDPDGYPLFRHLTGAKWAMHGRPFVTEDSFPDRKRAREILAELRTQIRRLNDSSRNQGISV
jgi:alpha 1,2-mannosyltransferase